jgi:LacI family transcriptional regulator
MGLRGSAEIAAATRQRIKAAAQALGYRPDPLLSALSSRASRRHRARANLALFVDDYWRDGSRPPSETDWLDACVRGMRVAAERFGYTLNEFLLDRHLRAWRKPDRVLAARGVTGIFLLPPGAPSKTFPEPDWKRYSVVAVGVPPNATRWHRAGTDAYGTMHHICERLKERGIRRVGLARQMNDIRRLRGEWLGALAKEWFLPDAAHPARPALQIVPPCLLPRMGREAFLRWYRREKPEVIVTHGHEAIDWLRAAGVRVPEDCGVVTLNSARITEGDTGIVQNLDQVGEGAVELMHGLVLRGEKGVPVTSRELLVSARWVEGATLTKG